MEPVDLSSQGGPPIDPEEWTDEQWLAWLKSSDDDAVDELDEQPAALASRVVRSTAGQVIGQAMLGMAQAIYGRRDEELVIVAEGSSEPLEDEPFIIRLDFDHPERSSVVFKGDSEPTS